MNIPLTDEGFVNAPSLQKGVYAVGTLKSPVDVARSVQDATGAVLKGIQSLVRR
jgi:heterodisulfide reductase subunit A-like polyferredoxin